MNREYDTHWSDAGLWQYPALLGAFSAVVEGSIVDIADEETSPGVFDGHALTALDGGIDGVHAIYYGGPTMGWHRTSESNLPNGTQVLARFGGVKGNPPAIVRHRQAGAHLLLFSPHLEAFEGIGVTELTTKQREVNYAARQRLILTEMSAR